MFTLFGSPSARMQKKATKLIGEEAMSLLKRMLEKEGKLGFLGVLVFLIVECGVQVETVEAGRNTKIIIKDTSKLRHALDRKLAEDNTKRDKKIEGIRKEISDLEKMKKQNMDEIMDFINALPDKRN